MLRNSAFAALRPDRFFNPPEGTWGAVYLAARMDRFYGDEDWITPVSYVSVREAEAYSIALTWALFPMHRLLLDYTHTNLSDPIKVRVQPDGSVDYIEEENVVTLRYSLDF
jgi:phosphate-selective porin